MAILVAAALVTERPDAAGPVDRLDQFRTLARAGRAGERRRGWVVRRLSARAGTRSQDEEIVESLGTGGLYASPAFLQDRLDAFGEAWGAAAVDVLPVGRLVVGAFQMSEVPGVNSVRVYGRLGARPPC